MIDFSLLRSLFQAMISGPVISIFVLFLPFGFLTGFIAVFDSKVTLLKTISPFLLLLPWFLLSLLISLANVRLVLIERKQGKRQTCFWVKTNRFADDRSGEESVNGHPGKMFASELRESLLKNVNNLQLSEPIGEDYGWGFWASREGRPALWVALSYVDGPKGGNREEEYVVSINQEPPFLPWNRLIYLPDADLRMKLEENLTAFLSLNEILYRREVEP